jgi:murein DD-endopeptidase MepM/ murein hydrolase activator NlpD
MPFTFDGAQLPPEAQFDPEELTQLLKQRQQKQAQQQAKTSAPQSQASSPAPAKPAPPLLKGPGIAKPLEGVAKFLEEKVYIPGADLIDNTFQGNKKTPEQIGAARQNARGIMDEKLQSFEDASKKDPAAEVVRAGLGMTEDYLEGVVNLPGQMLFGKDYKPVKSNLIKENNTVAGKALRTIGRYVIASKWGDKLTGGRLTAGKTGAALVGGRLVQGFVEDFIGADGTAEDNTLIGSTPFTKWLQTSDDNNPIHNRTLVGLEGALFEAAGTPAVKALGDLVKHSLAARKASKAKTELNMVLAELGGKYGIKLAPGTTQDDLSALIAETRRMLADPKMVDKQREAIRLKDLQEAQRRVVNNRNMDAANGRLNELIAKQYADDNFGATLDYTKKTESDMALRLLAEDPKRVKLNRLVTEAAGTGAGSKEIAEALRARIEAYPAAKILDDIANTVTYGGPPDEVVLNGMSWGEITGHLGSLDGAIGQYTKDLDALQKSIDFSAGQVVDWENLGNTKLAELEALQAEIPTLPRQADLPPAPSAALSLSKAQASLLSSIGLPDGVSVTAGRRVKGLTAETLPMVREALAGAIESGGKVADNLLKRIDGLAVPEAAAKDVRTQEGMQGMLDNLAKERDDLFGAAQQKRLESSPIYQQMEEMRAQVAELQIRREAVASKIRGDGETFAAKYIPVDMTPKNVTSFVKESAGGQPGIDLYFEDKRFPALLQGVVKEIGRQGNKSGGYGNFIVVESIDPKTGKSVDVLYAHLADNSIKVKEGDSIGVGQQLGTQGGTGSVRSADGTIASIDFLEAAPKGSKSMKPYERWSALADELTNGMKKGELKATPTPKTPKSVTPEVIADAARQADEIAPTKTRREALEGLAEVDELVNAKPRNTLLEAFADDGDSVVNTAKPGKVALTDMDVYSLANGAESLSLLKRVYSEIDKQIKYTPAETIEKMDGAVELATEMLYATDSELLALIKKNSTDVEGEGSLLTTKGFAANGLFIKELMKQAQDLSYSALNQIKDGTPEAFKEAERLLERMGAMVAIRKRHTEIASGKLREINYIGENLADGVNPKRTELFKELEAKYKDDVAKDDILYRQFDALKSRLRENDPKAWSDFQRAASHMAIAHPTVKNLNVGATLFSAIGKNFDSLYINSILSGPVTLARNFWGGFYQTIGHPMQAYLGTMLPGKHNALVRHQAIAALGATQESYREMVDLFPRLYKQQWNAMDDGIKEYSGWDPVLERNMARVKAMADNNELGPIAQSWMALAINGRKFLDSPYMRPMMAFIGSTDGFMKVVAARQMASRRAVEDAFKQMGDAPLTDKRAQEFGALVANLKEYHLGEIMDRNTLQITDPEAIKLGEVFTFQTPVEDLDGISKLLNDASSRPFMKTLGLTFIKTPAAILKASAHLTPGLSTLLKNMDKQYKEGDDYYRAMRDGQEAMSLFVGGSAFSLGMGGAMTGAGPLAGPERERWLMSHKPYTLTIGGMEIGYQALEPATTVLGLFADMGQLAMGGELEADNIIPHLLGAVSSNVVNKSYLQQLSTMSALISADPTKGSAWKKAGENIAKGLLPYSALRSQAGQVMDTAAREVRSLIEPAWSWGLKKHIGVGSTTALPQKLDPVTGKPLTRDGVEGPLGNGLAIINSIAPFGIRFSKQRFEKVHQLLESEGVDIEDAQRKLNTQDMTNEQMVEYTKLRADGGNLKKALLEYFYSDQYTKIDKPESERQRNEGLAVDKTYAHQNISNIVKGFHNQAVAQMEMGLNDVTAGFRERRQKALEAAAQSEVKYNDTSNKVQFGNYPY